MEKKMVFIHKGIGDYILEYIFFILKCLFLCFLPFIFLYFLSIFSSASANQIKHSISNVPVVGDLSLINDYVGSVDDLLTEY